MYFALPLSHYFHSPTLPLSHSPTQDTTPETFPPLIDSLLGSTLIIHFIQVFLFNNYTL